MGLKNELMKRARVKQLAAEQEAIDAQIRHRERQIAVTAERFRLSFPDVEPVEVDDYWATASDGIILRLGKDHWRLVVCTECDDGALPARIVNADDIGRALLDAPEHTHRYWCDDCENVHLARECPKAVADAEPANLADQIKLHARVDYAINCGVCPDHNANALSHRNLDILIKDAIDGGWILLPDGKFACGEHLRCACGAQLESQCGACQIVFAPHKGDVRDHV